MVVVVAGGGPKGCHGKEPLLQRKCEPRSFGLLPEPALPGDPTTDHQKHHRRLESSRAKGREWMKAGNENLTGELNRSINYENQQVSYHVLGRASAMLWQGIWVVTGDWLFQPPRSAHLADDDAYVVTPPGLPGRASKTASGEPTGRLQITVRDHATGQPTACRLNVIGPDGNFYQPTPNPLTPYSLTGQWPKTGKGNREGKAPIRYLGRFFYSTGDVEVAVPAGSVRIEVWKGFEYRPVVTEHRGRRGRNKARINRARTHRPNGCARLLLRRPAPALPTPDRDR